jgi:hypothetical protein
MLYSAMKMIAPYYHATIPSFNEVVYVKSPDRRILYQHFGPEIYLANIYPLFSVVD